MKQKADWTESCNGLCHLLFRAVWNFGQLVFTRIEKILNKPRGMPLVCVVLFLLNNISLTPNSMKIKRKVRE